jgi:hypothetical protein
VTVNGQPAVELVDEHGDRIDVAATDTPYPLRISTLDGDLMFRTLRPRAP